MTQDTQAGAGAHPAPAQQPKTLRELAEVVRDWGKRDHAWAHPDPDCFDVALFGHISEDGEPYPVAEVNPDTYGHEGVSLQLAQFYAAASPAAVLALLDRVALRDNELKAARADAKHWRTNHDNVVARLRIFTQRPDIPKELADRLPWYRELVRLQEVEAQALQQSAEITDAEIDRIAESMPGGLDGFLKAWGWRQFARAIMQAAPPAPAAVAVPEALRELIEAIEFAPLGVRAIQAMARARAALAAAPAQAVAVPEGWKLVPINDTPAMWTAGGRAIKSCGGHERDAASLAYKAMVEAAPPAQEHATQLAGQDGEQDEGLAQAIDERDTAEGWADGLAGLIGEYFGQDIGEHSSAHNPWQEAKEIIEEAEPYRSAAAPAQAQEDAPVVRAGLLAAAAHIRAKASAHAEECGSYDPDTGAFEMRDAVQDHYNTLDELAEEIRLMADKTAPASCDKPPAGWACSRAPGHVGPCAAARAAQGGAL